jgi:hypothetical protein
MNLGINDIVPEALHRKVGWDIRHHFMAEKVIDRFGLVLPRDRELIRQLAVVYVLEQANPPARRSLRAGTKNQATGGRAARATRLEDLK